MLTYLGGHPTEFFGTYFCVNIAGGVVFPFTLLVLGRHKSKYFDFTML